MQQQHIKYDLGQVKRGSTVVVTLDKQANVQLRSQISLLRRTNEEVPGEHPGAP